MQLADRAPAILEVIGLGVMCVDSMGKVHYRNKTAAIWTDSGDRIESVFGSARFPSAFDGWNRLLERVARTGEPSSVDCAFECPRGDRPALITLHLRPLNPSMQAFVGGERIAPKTSRSQAEIQKRDDICGDVVITMQPCAIARAVDERLEVSQRLLSLGKLAAQVAHELNNPLDGILRYINLALRLTDDSVEPKMKSYLTESRTGLIRMVEIIGDLLEYSRTSSGEFDAMSINEVVEQAIRNTPSPYEREKVLIAADFQDQQMPVVGGSRLYQVCCNLIKNALDAMPDGGRLSITTGLIDGIVVIRFADTGIGLPKSVDCIFRPFFTTKKPGKGTGLGLAICKEFVEAMQGTISAAGGPEGGAVFTVRIPASSCRRPSPLVHRLSAPEERAAVSG